MQEGQKVITVVCTGNICRSPMAERLLRHALAALPAPWCDIHVASAGTAAFAGDAASTHSLTALKKVGLDLSDHRSQPLSRSLVGNSDLILTMTQSHKDQVALAFPDLTVPVWRFREWVSGADKDVPDPYGGDLATYIETRDQIAESIPSLLQFIQSTFQP